MDYQKAEEILKTPIVSSFSKTKFRNAELRRKAIEWAIQLPAGKSLDMQEESIYHTTYSGSEIRFGKPGKEVFRERNPNKYDMTPILYEKREAQLSQTEKGFDFYELLEDIRTKITNNQEAGHVLLAMLYRCGVLDDHSVSTGQFCYNPDEEVMKWLDGQFSSIGNTPPSELIPMYDAIMLNDDIKIYTNPKRYQTSQLEPYKKQGRINTMGAIFAICAPESILSRIALSSLLIRGRGTPRIFEKQYGYGRDLIAPMTDGIIDYHDKQQKLSTDLI